jgi:hypothetical protein
VDSVSALDIGHCDAGLARVTEPDSAHFWDTCETCQRQISGACRAESQNLPSESAHLYGFESGAALQRIAAALNHRGHLTRRVLTGG